MNIETDSGSTGIGDKLRIKRNLIGNQDSAGIIYISSGYRAWTKDIHTKQRDTITHANSKTIQSMVVQINC